MATNSSGAAKMSPSQVFILLISAGVTLYMMFAYIGPFQWIAELQLRFMDSYSEKLTFLVAFLLVYGAMMLLTVPLRAYLPASATKAGNGQLAAAWVFLLLIGAGFAGVGCYSLHKLGNMGSYQNTSVEKLEAGGDPPSRFVSAAGYPVRQAAVSFGKDTSRSKDLYIPVISVQSDVPANGVRLFLKVKDQRSYSGSENSLGSFNGILEKNDLPGPVRVSMERAHLLKGNDYFVLELGETPESKQMSAKNMTYIGAGMAGLGLIIGLISWLRRAAER